MKFATIKLLFVALTILSVISLSSARRSASKSNARVHDGGVTTADQKLVEYETNLTIKEGETTTQHKIKIDQESFNHSNYGIQFAMESGAITAHAFFLVSANTYFFNFRNAHSFNCLNQATFTQRTMHFSTYLNKITTEVTFTFPNAWAFGATVNLLSLCDKFYNRWTNTSSKRNQLETSVMRLFSHIHMLEDTRKKNQNTKAGLQKQIGDLDNQIASFTIIVNNQVAAIKKASQGIQKIITQSNEQSAALEKLENSIKENEAMLANQNNFIDETNGNIGDIRQITDSEIENEWSSFKVSLTKMINLQSDVDPLKATLNGLVGNVKANVVTIMSALDI